MHFQPTLRAFIGLAGWAAAQATISVDVGTKYQAIDGFGFSQAFGRAQQFQDANATAQKQALDYLFDTTTGAGFSIIRNRIGSGGSGDSTGGESDSIEPNSPGSPSNPPTYIWDDNDVGQVWFTGEAVSYGVNTIYADAWGSPGFMKTSGNDSLPGYLCGTPGHPCATGDWRQAYANFLVKYVQLYASSGYNITHLGFLNEPDFSTTYSQMQISDNATEAIDFIPVLYDTLKAAGLVTEIVCCDATGWEKQSNYTTALVHAGSTKYLGKITGHAYSSDAETPLSITNLPKWNTEAGDGSENFTTTWYSSGAKHEGFTWAEKLAVAMVDAELSAYLYWEGFEIHQPQSASHLLDALDYENVTPSGIFWAFAMWSRYIRPGAHRVATSGSISNVTIGAFENVDCSVVVTFTNSGSTSQDVKLSPQGYWPRSAEAYVTDNNNTFAKMTVKLLGGAVSVAIPAKGVVTVKFA